VIHLQHCIIVIYTSSYVLNVLVYTLPEDGGWPQKHVETHFMVLISGN